MLFFLYMLCHSPEKMGQDNADYIEGPVDQQLPMGKAMKDLSLQGIWASM